MIQLHDPRIYDLHQAHLKDTERQKDETVGKSKAGVSSLVINKI